MKKVLVSLATAGLLLATSAAFSQNTESRRLAAPTADQASPPAAVESGERRGERRGDGSERRGQRSEPNERRDGGSVTVRRGGDGAGTRVRERGDRGQIRVRVDGDRHGYRYRHGHLHVAHSGCRMVIVKKRSYNRTVIKRIRRC